MSFLKKNKVTLLIVALIIIGSVIGYQQIFKTTEDVAQTTKVDFEGTSKDFLTLLNTDASIWNNKVIVIEGVVSAVNDEGIILDNTIFCQFTDNAILTTFKENQTLKVKGLVIGYDDLLEELKLNQCIINN
ncbi:hypothetical protein [Tenacibaculum agarivorans]|uniref:hypothetical protein n=1 Tax=Tenacibaculum agarivorans TaxID=1908389 RepID=UPI00094B8E20|nr:hypothetical protein [Tenacibaculum agarivorans]